VLLSRGEAAGIRLQEMLPERHSTYSALAEQTGWEAL
jgi:hypothetical protein